MNIELFNKKKEATASKTPRLKLNLERPVRRTSVPSFNFKTELGKLVNEEKILQRRAS